MNIISSEIYLSRTACMAIMLPVELLSHKARTHLLYYNTQIVN